MFAKIYRKRLKSIKVNDDWHRDNYIWIEGPSCFALLLVWFVKCVVFVVVCLLCHMV